MLISPISKPVILITMGDPAGIGPEVIMKAVASPRIKGLATFVLIGDMRHLQRTAREVCGYEALVHNVSLAGGEVKLFPDKLNVVDPGGAFEGCGFGSPTKDGDLKALKCLDTAVALMKDPGFPERKALVTAPVNKERMSLVSPGFRGHTEYLQKAYSAKMVTMVLTGKTLCVVPVTRHIPLSAVPGSITAEKIEGTLRQVVENRVLISGNENAKIGVCALNPHSGEGGKIGTEEIEVIAPAVNKAKKWYERIEGPISADVIFYKALKKEIDVVVSMYHDQSLAPFKMIDFDNGVNITLGLGHVRTSPDHGTAYDISGKGIADPGSMERAIELACRAISLI